jgi:hypothetical protein
MDDLEQVLRANLTLRRELAVEVAKAVEPVALSHKILKMKTGAFDWWLNRFGRSEDQPVIFALLFVLIAITLYVFL